jgi:hypothetical protein
VIARTTTYKVMHKAIYAYLFPLLDNGLIHKTIYHHETTRRLDLREIQTGGKNWIQLARDMVQWRAFVKMMMNLQVP